MVVICLPSAALTGSEHERTASPSTCTVQAPHWAMPQPYLVPVRPMFSRIAHNSGVSGGTSTLWGCPLIVRRAIRSSSRHTGPSSQFAAIYSLGEHRLWRALSSKRQTALTVRQSQQRERSSMLRCNIDRRWATAHLLCAPRVDALEAYLQRLAGRLPIERLQ